MSSVLHFFWLIIYFTYIILMFYTGLIVVRGMHSGSLSWSVE